MPPYWPTPSPEFSSRGSTAGKSSHRKNGSHHTGQPHSQSSIRGFLQQINATTILTNPNIFFFFFSSSLLLLLPLILILRPDTFSLGVCNGCQLMALLGWIGDLEDDEGDKENSPPRLEMQAPKPVRFTHNKRCKFVCLHLFTCVCLRVFGAFEFVVFVLCSFVSLSAIFVVS